MENLYLKLKEQYNDGTLSGKGKKAVYRLLGANSAFEKEAVGEILRRLEKEGEIVSLVDVDFLEYRRKNELRTVKKNCTLPGWLCYEAEKANINFSQVLQTALKQELHIVE